MDLVYEQNCVVALSQVGQQALETLFKIAPVFSARQQRAQVERVNHRLLEGVGHLPVDDHFRQTLCDRSFADPGLAHQKRVVFTPPRQNLCDPLHLIQTADQGVNIPCLGFRIQVGCVSVQRPFLGGSLSILNIT